MENKILTLGTTKFEPKIDSSGWPEERLQEFLGIREVVRKQGGIGSFPENPEKDPQIGKYKRFMPIASAFAAMSKYPGTRVGCIILGEGFQVLSSGWNGAPRGSDADVDGRLADRETRLSWATHAEANAIANAARSGTALLGGTLICTLMPCMACAKSIVQAGVKRVICPEPGPANSAWDSEFKLAESLFAEVGVELHFATFGERV